jgi:hypothetical protein
MPHHRVILLPIKSRQYSGILFEEGVEVDRQDVFGGDVGEIERSLAIFADKPSSRKIPATFGPGLYVVVELAFFPLLLNICCQ